VEAFESRGRAIGEQNQKIVGRGGTPIYAHFLQGEKPSGYREIIQRLDGEVGYSNQDSRKYT